MEGTIQNVTSNLSGGKKFILIGATMDMNALTFLISGILCFQFNQFPQMLFLLGIQMMVSDIGRITYDKIVKLFGWRCGRKIKKINFYRMVFPKLDRGIAVKDIHLKSLR